MILSPDLPGLLFHFTGRTRSPGAVVPEFALGSPAERLSSILLGQSLLAAKTYGTRGPVVCFSEMSEAAFRALLTHGLNNRGPYPPWGLFLRRQEMVALGAGPVWYMRDSEYTASEGLPPRMLDRRVKSNPGSSPDWMSEREWRICWGNDPQSGEEFGVPLTVESVAAVLVGEQGWNPSARTRTSAESQLPEWLRDVRRVLWAGTELLSDGNLGD